MQISPVEIGARDLTGPMEIFPRSAAFPGLSPLGTSSCLTEAQGLTCVCVRVRVCVCVCARARGWG